MSATPYYLCAAGLIAVIAILLVILIIREVHHTRIQAGLIDKILEQHGLNAIPKEHPLAEIIQTVTRKADEPEEQPVRMRIPIPGMAAFRREYNRVMTVKEKGNK